MLPSEVRVASDRARRSRVLVTLGCVAAVVSACGGEPGPPPPSADETSRRTISTGEVIGMIGAYGSHVWKGLPYAAPPVGERRWRAPLAPAAWKGIREALVSGSPCPQFASPFGGVVDQPPGSHAGSEDCLYLDVYAPHMRPESLPGAGERLPVMVWIHGGGNVVGHAGFYDGGHLAQTENVIVVMIQYRLGPLGFFRHGAIRSRAGDPLEASGNFALLDQVRALEWVQENAAAFGGDPGNVTVFGESAGARNVLALVLSPIAEGLFHRAISQSGSASALPLDEAESYRDAAPPGHRNSSGEIAVRHLIASGQAADRGAAKARIEALGDEGVAELLYGLSPEALLLLYRTADAQGLMDVPNVFGDGSVVRSGVPVENLSRATGANRVPILLGTNRDESRVFMSANPRYVRKLLWILPRMRDEARYLAESAISSTTWQVTGADAPASALARGGHDAVFVYRWDWDEEPTVLGADLSVMLGAAHGFEIPFVFGHYDLGPGAKAVWTPENLPGREALSSAMMSYWAEFARAGDPGRGSRGDLPEWTPWGGSGGSAPRRMVLDTPAGGGPRMEDGATAPEDLIALLDQHAATLGAGGLCEVTESLARSLHGVSDVAEPRALACAGASVASRR